MSETALVRYDVEDGIGIITVDNPPVNALGAAVRQGLVAGFFGIGTRVVHPRITDRVLTLRGVFDPGEVKRNIEALAHRRNRVTTHPPANL